MSYEPGDWRDVEVKVHRAGAIGQTHVPTLAIYAHDELSNDGMTLPDARKLYEEEGERVAEALWQSLPAGTLDQLLVGLLKRHASLFRVGHCS